MTRYYKSSGKKSVKRRPPIPNPTNLHDHTNYKMAALLVSAAAFAYALTLIFLSISSNSLGLEPSIDRIYDVQVVNEFPHDPDAFTQGLLYAGNDALFESTGLYGHSSVRKVAIRTGKVEVMHKMDNSYFGEGLTLLGDRLFQVNWLTKTGFIYDRNNLSKVKIFNNQMKDGWGLATDGQVLFGSDGTSTLYQIDPQTMKVVRNHTVKFKGDEVYNLNELEFVAGEVWANVWETDCIARISGKDGLVLGWIYLPKLRKGLVASGNSIDVLNGIAWDQAQNRIFITGKLWPKLYEIKLQRLKKPFKGDIKKLCMPPAVHF
ncbi:glutaminyl-peptide cyclotransferase-like isoform X2 [Salvia hispanica]|uniref:glutaminyl-peptide cyclotransferase-like isoform X2 n=1 Tax=Salvia hispanica TaxID=49212 RepID=UPI002008FE2B|nr:glutaminyl-peptide cyclotransferase-like isoform X2 [Salvia hispanica]